MRPFALLLLGVLWVFGAHAAPPNVVMIISDDHAWTDYGFMGHAQIKTPHLDKLASESLVFPRGYVPSSLCCPSLASIITGRFPHEHKVTSNDPPLPEGRKPAQLQRAPGFAEGREKMNKFMDALPTLPRVLTKNGYLTLQTGKWWQGHYSRGGFTHGMTKGNRHGDAGLDIGRKTMQPIYDFIAEARKAEKPFFVWYAPMLPHDPHTPPERLLAKYRDAAPTPSIAKYWAMVEWFDETCGELVRHLDEQGLSKETLVVYVTDNGWIQNPDGPKYAPKSKQSQYDGGLRTPIMLRWPGRIAPGRNEALASSLDLYPTILAACDLPVEGTLPGLNLLDAEKVAARKRIFGECFTHNSKNLDEPAASLRWRWMIEGTWKLIVPAPQNEPDGVVELYDLAADPHENANLAGKSAERVEQMRAQLDAWWPGVN